MGVIACGVKEVRKNAVKMNTGRERKGNTATRIYKKVTRTKVEFNQKKEVLLST